MTFCNRCRCSCCYDCPYDVVCRHVSDDDENAYVAFFVPRQLYYPLMLKSKSTFVPGIVIIRRRRRGNGGEGKKIGRMHYVLAMVCLNCIIPPTLLSHDNNSHERRNLFNLLFNVLMILVFGDARPPRIFNALLRAVWNMNGRCRETPFSGHFECKRRFHHYDNKIMNK